MPIISGCWYHRVIHARRICLSDIGTDNKLRIFLTHCTEKHTLYLFIIFTRNFFPSDFIPYSVSMAQFTSTPIFSSILNNAPPQRNDLILSTHSSQVGRLIVSRTTHQKLFTHICSVVSLTREMTMHTSWYLSPIFLWQARVSAAFFL